MTLSIGSDASDFEAETTEGKIRFHEWLGANHKVATPVNWKHGDDVIIVPAVSDEEAKAKFPAGWEAPKPYIRIVQQPA